MFYSKKCSVFFFFFWMGNTCIPVADSFRYMAKPIQYCKVKNKIKLLKKRNVLLIIKNRRKISLNSSFLLIESLYTHFLASVRRVDV